MKKIKKVRIPGVVCFPAAAALMLLAGCATTDDKASIPDENMAVSVTIEAPGTPGEIRKVENMKNPAEIIELARNLSGAGRHAESAAIYMDAAERFSSVGREFETDCKKAAVREYCLAGDFEQARDILDEVEKEQDIYGMAYESEDFKKLRAMLARTEQILNESR